MEFLGVSHYEKCIILMEEVKSGHAYLLEIINSCKHIVVEMGYNVIFKTYRLYDTNQN